MQTSVSCQSPLLGHDIFGRHLGHVLQYMMVYQLLVSMGINSAFFMDGSSMSTAQVSPSA